ncbi:response regulator transcription factor [[Clostridium] spiroforme]|nr:response regulator transcription factor [Thomasclavelia spiroformis]
MQKIMIVEDDDIIASAIKKHLETWHYEVDIVNDFEHVLEFYLKNQPELILLDISLPFYDGYHWCQQIRKVSSVPIIFISSASENMNIVMAMTMGGDDFITKPFDFHVLTAKIQALLRRTYSFSKSIQILTYKELRLNVLDATISYQDITVDLTKNELKILQTLFEKAEHFVSRDELMMNLWQSDAFIDDNTLSVNMNRLRKKLDIFNIAHLIQTKKGLGYQLYYE